MNRVLLMCVILILFFSCTSSEPARAKLPGTSAPDADVPSACGAILKYPVVLAHGIFAHDRDGIIEFWGRIPDVLRSMGVKVYLGNTDAWSRYETSAEVLKQTIDRVLIETNSEKVNIIAHSKGGIDSRYLIWKYDYGDKVASLTTISTPHHGAELADLIFRFDIIHTNEVKRALEIFGELYGDTNPDLYNLNYQLTTAHMKEFNEIVLMDSNVYCQSIYTTMRNRFDDMMFFYSFGYIKFVGGANDGVVSEASAQWSDNIKKIEGISHAEIVDYKLRKISGMYIPDIYVDIVRDLGERGF